jgi:hypothetical protein
MKKEIIRINRTLPGIFGTPLPQAVPDVWLDGAISTAAR